MAKTIKVAEIGRLIDEEPYIINDWFNYDLGSGFDGVFNGKRPGKTRNRGSVIQGINKDIDIQKVMKNANNGDFDEIAGFYPAIFLFFGKKFIDKVDFTDKAGRNRISRLIDNLKGPKHLKSEIYDFLEQKFDFLTFLEACGRNKKLNFDVKSAISVYKLQGDAAIYPIICQIFYVNKGIDNLGIKLIDDLPVHFDVQISNFVSGCHFPVAVSPSVSEFKCENTPNGHFLYAKYENEWRVLDVFGVGSVNLSNYALTNRLNYLGSGGLAVPWRICWNWGEIIEAYHYFGSNLLIRDLKNDIFSHYWFNFGLNSYINVSYENNLVNCRGNLTFPIDIRANIPTGQKHFLTVQLNGNFVKYCEKNEICYSKEEICDWFELAELLK